MEELSKEVLKKISELKDIIENSEEYKKYKEINKRLDSNKEVKEKIKVIKQIQQELVKSEYNKDYEKAKILEQSLEKNHKELNEIPIYNEYVHIIEKLNESLKEIKRIEEYLKTITN